MYDVLIIGGGPGGYAAAIRTSQLGGKAALIESGDFGGTCVNRGCIPSKIWLRAAYLYAMAGNADQFGIDLSLNGVNVQTLVQRKQGVASEIQTGMKALLANYGVDVITASGVLKNHREVSAEGTIVSARNIILATGSSAYRPDIPGIDGATTVDELYDMEKLPRSALIWGAGYNEVEAAHVLASFGVSVTLATDGARILPREDHDVSQRMAMALRQRGLEILTRHAFSSMGKEKSGYRALLAGGGERQLDVEKVFIGTRKPNTEGLGLEKVGIALKEDDGGVKTDSRMSTSVEGIYAVGDVTGGWMLSHVASSMAVVAAENAMGKDREFRANIVSRGLWTHPQVGAVGLSEEEAEKEGYDVVAGIFPYAINGLAMGQGLVEGSVKVVCDAQHGDILGVHIVGENATELVGEAAFALELECSIDELSYGIRLHPSYSEALVDAARDAGDWALYLPRKSTT